MSKSMYAPAAAVIGITGLLALSVMLMPPMSAGKARAQQGADDAQAKADLPAVVQGNTEFAFALYSQVRGEKGNLFLSPYSISTALAMTSSGADGNTLSQMEKALRFPVGQARLHPAFGLLLKQTRSGKGYQLHVANALWCQTGVPFREDFLSINEKYYDAKPTGVDFAASPEQARLTINAWVEKQTQEKIKDLLKPGVISALTRLVLTNAIYFKGDWARKFDPKQTRDEPFWLNPTTQVKVPMMRQTGEFPYLVQGDFQALELPYAGEEISMVILVPTKADGLAELEKSLTTEKFHEVLKKLHPTPGLEVAVPRFKVTAEFNLNQALSNLGMIDAFDDRKADFSRISPVARKQGWHITAVVHKAFVEVNEEGTEAAAATGVVIGIRSLPPSFRADRPFFFLIRDKRTNSILFMGRVVDPRS
ncbi:MAG: serpin family protein [Gemmatales bacterium]|nr:serpin family protein [Gemmatales bacterium]MDW7995872.1 serpin family protein [Gemmatales bacterium]